MERYRGEPQTLANWLNGDVTGFLNAEGKEVRASKLTPEHLVTLVTLIDEGAISGKTAKDLLPEVMAGGEPKSLVEARGLGQLTDSAAVAKIVDEVMRANPALVESVADNPKAVNALLGRVMRETKGRAKPDLVREILNEKLGVVEGV